jgi:hypothetical protein
MMKRLIVVLLNSLCGIIVLMSVSCKKDKHPVSLPPPAPPKMEYFNLNDTTVKANQPGFSIDVNHDGRKDLAFKTLLVGDPVYQVDKLQFVVGSNIKINLPVNANEQVPVLNDGDLIQSENFNGYQWFELSSIVLVQKIISVAAPVRWEGLWKDAVHKFLPYQAVMDNKRYNGWVELSVDITGERVVLHKASISEEAERSVIAGR